MNGMNADKALEKLSFVAASCFTQRVTLLGEGFNSERPHHLRWSAFICGFNCSLQIQPFLIVGLTRFGGLLGIGVAVFGGRPRWTRQE